MSIFEIPAQPGILPYQSIETLIATGAIRSDTPFDHDQVQPASQDRSGVGVDCNRAAVIRAVSSDIKVSLLFSTRSLGRPQPCGL